MKLVIRKKLVDLIKTCLNNSQGRVPASNKLSESFGIMLNGITQVSAYADVLNVVGDNRDILKKKKYGTPNYERATCRIRD